MVCVYIAKTSNAVHFRFLLENITPPPPPKHFFLCFPTPKFWRPSPPVVMVKENK